MNKGTLLFVAGACVLLYIFLSKSADAVQKASKEQADYLEDQVNTISH